MKMLPSSVEACPVPHLKEDQSWDVDWFCSRLSWRASATERHMRMPSSLSGMRMFSIFDVAMKRFTLLMLVSAALRSHRHPPFRADPVVMLALYFLGTARGEQHASRKVLSDASGSPSGMAMTTGRQLSRCPLPGNRADATHPAHIHLVALSN